MTARSRKEPKAQALTLRELREALGMTQAVLPSRMKMGQAELSALERREDWKLSTPQRYVEELSAELELVANVGAGSGYGTRWGFARISAGNPDRFPECPSIQDADLVGTAPRVPTVDHAN